MEHAAWHYAPVIEADWIRVGGYLLTALQEVALERGGDLLLEQINEAAIPCTPLPNSEAFAFIERAYPGSAEAVMARSAAIQAETHRREREELASRTARRNRSAALDGLASLISFGRSPRSDRQW